MTVGRPADVRRLYALLGELGERVGGTRCLRDCDGRQPWPARGVYFFFEAGEVRSTSGEGPRVVRIGTHALKPSSMTSLWNRLSQHRGAARSGGGNHRGSIFRLLVGEAILRREGLHVQSWGVGQSLSEAAARLGASSSELKEREAPVEAAVSRHIGAMPFLWLPIDDDPGPDSARGIVERNAIALLSNWRRAVVDPASPAWLGAQSSRDAVRLSSLWNNQHVDETHSSAFLDMLAAMVLRVGRMG